MINKKARWLLMCSGLIVSSTLDAQQLPKLQKGSVYLTEKVKIDGKTLELNNSFKAFNKATDCFYTIANDDKILYLRIQVRLREISTKILSGGVTFSIGANRNKKDSSFVQITFPVLEDNDRNYLINLLSSKDKLARDSKDKETDVADLNQAFSASTKSIKTDGVFDSEEQIISIYNDKGIMTAAQFDTHLYYTYELKIPLSYIKALRYNKKSFNYNIQLNPAKSKPYQPGGGPPSPPVEITNASSTDFWHEYTLAEKQ